MRHILLLSLLFLHTLNGFGEGYTDFLGYVRNIAAYNRSYPQEKVYLKEWNHLIDRGVPGANVFFDDGLWNMVLADYEKISKNQPLHYSLEEPSCGAK